MGSDGGQGPVLAHSLVELRLDTEELLEILSGEVQVTYVATDNVRPYLSSSVINKPLLTFLPHLSH